MENRLSLKKALFIVFSALLLGVILGAFVLPNSANAEETFKKAVIKTSAQCEMCKDRIEKAFSKVEGIQSAVLDVDSKDFTVSYDETKITLEKIRKILNKTGYDADDQPADEKAYKKLPKCCKKPN